MRLDLYGKSRGFTRNPQKVKPFAGGSTATKSGGVDWELGRLIQQVDWSSSLLEGR